jgi:DNA-binding CsgD family transcriptional regulator
VARDQRNYQLAVVRYRDVLDRVRERGDMRLVADSLAGIASAAAEWGHARAAARLFGAAAALRERVGTAILLPADLAAEERGLRLLREALGTERVAALLDEGRALTRTEAEAEAATVVAMVEGTPEPSVGAAPDRLSSREVEVLRLLVAQQTNQEIAAALYLSPRTISWHVTRILDKLGVRSRREAAARAVAEELI